jgi:hypothetical protein
MIRLSLTGLSAKNVLRGTHPSKRLAFGMNKGTAHGSFP